MNQIVTIVLTGLCLLVRPAPQNGVTIMRALMVQSPGADSHAQGVTIPAHEAFILVRTKDIGEKTVRVPDLEFKIGSYDYSLFLLKNERIFIDGVKETALTFDGEKSGLVDVSEDRRPFDDKEGVRDFQDICDACPIGKNTGFGLGIGVGAEFRLDKGHVAASGVDDSETWDFCDQAQTKCKFNGVPSAQVKMPQQVTVDMTLAKSTITLRSADVSNCVVENNQVTDKCPFVSAKSITLTPRGDLQIVVGSGPISDIVGLGAAHAKDKIDEHFELYYGLADDANAVYRVPMQLPLAGATTQQHAGQPGLAPLLAIFVHSSNCPPVQYKLATGAANAKKKK
jgi:hypothetical protein